nr:MFS transporter [bacterium]
MSADASHSHPAMDWKPKHSPWIVAVSVILPTCLEVLDTTIVSVALNHIAGNLSATYDEATWVLTSYLISNAIVLPASGWLSRYLGRKPFFMTCIGLFTFASYLCGSAHSIHFLILMRVFQGVG